MVLGRRQRRSGDDPIPEGAGPSRNNLRQNIPVPRRRQAREHLPGGGERFAEGTIEVSRS